MGQFYIPRISKKGRLVTAKVISVTSVVLIFLPAVLIYFSPPEIVPSRDDLKLYAEGKNLEDLVKPWLETLKWGIIILTAFASTFFIRVWEHWLQRFTRTDLALYWFALAMLVWALADTSFATWIPYFNLHQPSFKTFFSQLNNLFFLLSFQHFQYGFRQTILPRLGKLGITAKNYEKSIFVLFFLIFSVTIWPDFNKEKAELFSWDALGNIINFLMSLLVAFGLMLVLWSSFSERRLKNIAWLSAVPFLCFLVVEVARFVTRLNFIGAIPEMKIKIDVLAQGMGIVSKVTMIVLVAGLAMSWLLEKIELQKNEMIHFVKGSLHQFLLDVKDENAAGTITPQMITRLQNLRDLVEIVYVESGEMLVDLGKFLNETLKSMADILGFEPKWDFTALNGVHAFGDPARNLGKLVTELVLNAYKYGGGLVDIRAETKEDELTIKLTDAGKSDFNYKPRPDQTGLGMKLFDIYLEALKGRFDVTPNPSGSGKTLNLYFSKSTFIEEVGPAFTEKELAS